MPTSLEQLRAQHPHLSDDAIADLASLSLKMSGNTKTRKPFLSMLKDVAPGTPVPEIDTEAAVNAALAEERKAREALEKKIEEKDFAAALASQRGEARDKYGLSDADMTAMEEMMKKGELPADYRFAPPLYKQQTESARPTNYGTGGYGPLDLNHHIKSDKALEGLMDEPDAWSLRTAHAMIDDIQRKGRTPAF